MPTKRHVQKLLGQTTHAILHRLPLMQKKGQLTMLNNARDRVLEALKEAGPEGIPLHGAFLIGDRSPASTLSRAIRDLIGEGIVNLTDDRRLCLAENPKQPITDLSVEIKNIIQKELQRQTENIQQDPLYVSALDDHKYDNYPDLNAIADALIRDLGIKQLIFDSEGHLGTNRFHCYSTPWTIISQTVKENK
jgi:hypothetical protein